MRRRREIGSIPRLFLLVELPVLDLVVEAGRLLAGDRVLNGIGSEGTITLSNSSKKSKNWFVIWQVALCIRKSPLDSIYILPCTQTNLWYSDHRIHVTCCLRLLLLIPISWSMNLPARSCRWACPGRRRCRCRRWRTSGPSPGRPSPSRPGGVSRCERPVVIDRVGWGLGWWHRTLSLWHDVLRQQIS